MTHRRSAERPACLGLGALYSRCPDAYRMMADRTTRLPKLRSRRGPELRQDPDRRPGPPFRPLRLARESREGRPAVRRVVGPTPGLAAHRRCRRTPADLTVFGLILADLAAWTAMHPGGHFPIGPTGPYRNHSNKLLNQQYFEGLKVKQSRLLHPGALVRRNRTTHVGFRAEVAEVTVRYAPDRTGHFPGIVRAKADNS